MSEDLTPKQVAQALSVSESSIKRWCDNGDISAQYTAGGHRRIPMASLADFLRDSRHRLVNPAALGLPATSTPSPRSLFQAREQMLDALLAGDEASCRQIAINLYMAEHSVSVICDEVLTVAFHEIGERWECSSAEIFQERHGCEIATRLLHELRTLLPSPPEQALLAIGGTPSGDHYSLCTTMVEMVLRDGKWDAMSLGNNLPFETIAAAIRQHHPKLFWLSCSHIENLDDFLAGYKQLQHEFESDVAFVVGGRALTEDIRQKMKYSAHCDSLQHLEGFASSLMSAIER